jgi:hypothetical protein
MTDDATFTLTLDQNLRDRFIAEADATMQAPEDVLRDLMRDFVARRRAASAELESEIIQAIHEADDPAIERVPHQEALSRLGEQRALMISRATQKAV